jgi:hypothetical protein
VEAPDPVGQVLLEQWSLGTAARRLPDGGSIGPHTNRHRLALAADDAPAEMRRHEPEVDESPLLATQRLDEPGLLVRTRTGR